MKRKHAFLHLNILFQLQHSSKCAYFLSLPKVLTPVHNIILSSNQKLPHHQLLSLPLLSPIHSIYLANSTSYFLLKSLLPLSSPPPQDSCRSTSYLENGKCLLIRVLSHLKGTRTFRNEVIIKTTKHQQKQRAPCI